MFTGMCLSMGGTWSGGVPALMVERVACSAGVCLVQGVPALRVLAPGGVLPGGCLVQREPAPGGCLVQGGAYSLGGAWWSPTQTATAAGGTHPI